MADTNIIANSVEDKIGSTYTFCTHNIAARIHQNFGYNLHIFLVQNVYANAFFFVCVATPHSLRHSKIALVRTYLRVPQAAGQEKILIFVVIIIFPHVCQYFCDAGQVPILRYLQAKDVTGM